jgi:tRNA dimethylallyltransferase
LAKELGGEIINADARQVYRDLDIGTGKPDGRRTRVKGHGCYLVNDVPHYLMDFLSPEQTYTVMDWQASALRAIRGITKRGRLPIVVGGTGLYISSLVDNYGFSGVPPQPELRKAYEQKSLEELARVLLAADADAGSVVDLKNKRRVVRALEVVAFSGQKVSVLRAKSKPLVEAFQVGISRTTQELKDRLEDTVDNMVRRGLVKEVRGLLADGLSPDTPGMTSIGYRDIVRFLHGEISEAEAVLLMKRHTRQYTKRQITWFKRDTRIHWIASEEEGLAAVKGWLKG